LSDYQEKFRQLEHHNLLSCAGIRVFKDKMTPHFSKPLGVAITVKIKEYGGAIHPAKLMKYLKQILQLFEFLNKKGYHYGHLKVEDIYISVTDSVEV
jgi:hypothetical protein